MVNIEVVGITDSLHLNAGLIRWTVCPTTFSKRNNAKTQYEYFHLKKGFSCTICGESLATGYNLRLHWERFHKAVKERCRCRRRFFLPSYF